MSTPNLTGTGTTIFMIIFMTIMALTSCLETESTDCEIIAEHKQSLVQRNGKVFSRATTKQNTQIITIPLTSGSLSSKHEACPS